MTLSPVQRIAGSEAGGRYVNPGADPLHAWQIDRAKNVAYCPQHKAEGEAE